MRVDYEIYTNWRLHIIQQTQYRETQEPEREYDKWENMCREGNLKEWANLYIQSKYSI